MSIISRSFPTALMAALVLVAPAAAERRDNQDKQLDCNDRNRSKRGWSCEIRESSIGAGSLHVDAGTNGGVTIKGANRGDILVRARVEAAADSDAEASSTAARVRIDTSGRSVRSEGPQNLGRREWWSVTYEVFVPWKTDVELKTHNGGVRIADVQGEIAFGAVNGGVSLQRLAGTVRGSTTNGGVTIELTGSRWDGGGLDVQTTNGGLTVSVPEGYSARLEAATVNGGMHIGFPVTVQGDTRRSLTATLGSGGAPIKVATTNGGILIKRS